MKPTAPVARKRDYFLSRCEHKIASDLIRRFHYSGSASNTGKAWCASDKSGEVVAAALFLPPLPPAARYVAKVGAERGRTIDPKRVVALSRLVVVPGQPQNVASMVVGQALRDLRKEGKYQAVVTFADTSAGHTGQVYRAMNAEYLGMTGPTTYWTDANDARVSCKATKSRTVAQMRELGYTSHRSLGKHRFVWWL